MNETTVIPPKMAEVVLLPVVNSVSSCEVDPHVHVGVSGDVAGVMGLVEGCCATTTPVKENKLSLNYYYG